MSRRSLIAGLAVALALALLPAVPRSAAQNGSGPSLGEQQAAAERMMDQLDAVHGSVDLDELVADPALGPPPWTSYVPDRDPSTISAWNAIAARISDAKVDANDLADADAAARRLGVAGVQDIEASTEIGANDSIQTGQHIASFGSAPGQDDRAQLIGTLGGDPPIPPEPPIVMCPSIEDDGNIDDANSALTDEINGMLCEGTIGDGEFGQTSGDIDMFEMGFANAGSPMIADVTGPAGLAVTVAVYDQSGTLIASADDFGPEHLELVAPADGSYFAAVAGLDGLPANPFDSASGPGATTTSPYALFIAVAAVPPPPCLSSEDDGAIGLANQVQPPNPQFVTCLGMIGDGPFAATSGDVDMFKVDVDIESGLLITDLAPAPNAVPARLAIYDAEGTRLGFVDDDVVAGDRDSSLVVQVSGPASYFVMVSAEGHSPTDANDSASGTGNLDTLQYEIIIATVPDPPNPVPTPTPAPPPPALPCLSIEDDGSIQSANPVPFESNSTSCFGFIGDGPAAASGDVDGFTLLVESPEAEIVVDILRAELPVEFVLYDDAGTIVPLDSGIAAADVDPRALNRANVARGRYHVMISEFGRSLADPFDSASGPGPNGAVGGYGVTFTVNPLRDGPDIGDPEPRPEEPRPPEPRPPEPQPVVPVPVAAHQTIQAQVGERLEVIDTAVTAMLGQGHAARAESLPAACESVEDDGSIQLANATRSTAAVGARCNGVIGDGPFGDSTGDFDVYSVDGVAGEIFAAHVYAASIESPLDSHLWLFDADGTLLADNDDGDGFDSQISVPLPSDGTFYVVVGGSSSALDDPFDSSSGTGAGSTGRYALVVGTFTEPPVSDIDVYLVDLVPGDVLRAGMTVTGTVAIVDPNGIVRQQSATSISFIYPLTSPLRHLGSVGVDHVADVAGTYAVVIANGYGPYLGELMVTRPGRASASGDDTQIVYLDFDGAAVDPQMFDPFGPPSAEVQLSALETFLPRWGLDAGDEDAVIDAVVVNFTENLSHDLRVVGGNGDRDASGIAGDFDIEILNSRDHPDPWGEPNVTRIVIGGSIEELGIPTVGIAQTIDPGNLDAEETGIVLLDLLSDPAGAGTPTLNDFAVVGDATIVDLVGTGVGVIAAHEFGHLIGNWHTDVMNLNPGVMDEGGDLAAVVGVGPDRVFGTADDADTDFHEDSYSMVEGLSGIEDTRIRSGFAMATGQTVPEVPEVPGPGVYLLQNVATDLYLDADRGNQADVSVNPREDDQWELVETDSGVYLRNVVYARVLDTDPGDGVDLSTSPSGDDVWAIDLIGEDRYIVHAVQRGGNLTVDGSDVDRSNSTATDAQWRFIPVGDPPQPPEPPEPPVGPGELVGTLIALRSAATDRYLDTDWGDNAWNVDQSERQSADDVWLVGNAGDGAVYLINNETGRYLDADGSGSGYNVDTSRNPSADDRWMIDQTDGGVTLRNLDRGRWLSADGAPGYGVGTDARQSLATTWKVVAIAEAH